MAASREVSWPLCLGIAIDCRPIVCILCIVHTYEYCIVCIAICKEHKKYILPSNWWHQYDLCMIAVFIYDFSIAAKYNVQFWQHFCQLDNSGDLSESNDQTGCIAYYTEQRCNITIFWQIHLKVTFLVRSQFHFIFCGARHKTISSVASGGLSEFPPFPDQHLGWFSSKGGNLSFKK